MKINLMILHHHLQHLHHRLMEVNHRRKNIIVIQVVEIIEQNVNDIVQTQEAVMVLVNHRVKQIMMKQHQQH